MLVINNQSKTSSRELREIVAGKLGVPPESIRQEEIDAVLLDALTEPAEDNEEETKRNRETKKKTAAKRVEKQAKRANPADAKGSEKTIDKLKGYIAKCGMRRQWKRELEGLGEKEIIRRLESILRDELGMEGRPSLEKCAKIKKRREFEEEMKEIDPGNIIEGPRLRHAANQRLSP